MKCDKCGEDMWLLSEGRTLVGYYSPPGHDHDDNCVTRYYACPNNHRQSTSKRNTCPVCDWRGKAECFCCGPKVDAWPD